MQTRIRILKGTESFRHLSGYPVKIITVRQPKPVLQEPATVTPILKALEYNKRNQKAA